MSKVMIVDDTEFLRLRITRMLTEDGFNTVEAEDGQIAVNVYKNEHPDLVLMDLSMPNMDGLTALRKIKEHDPQALVIMLTALGQESTVLEAIQSGAKDYIVKPFQKERVLSAINKLLCN